MTTGNKSPENSASEQVDSKEGTGKPSEKGNCGQSDNLFDIIQPFPEPVDGGELLDEIATQFKKYMVLPSGVAEVGALWVLHTWVFHAFQVSPILAISSPEKRCGKTTFLQLLHFMVDKAFPTSNVTPAALFRSVEKWQPTLLIDEADTFLKGDPEMQGVLNSGHVRQFAYIVRCDGPNYEPKRFSTWAPKAIAFIGKDKMHSTTRDRSIEVLLRRKLTSEPVATLRADHYREFIPIKKKCLRWARDHLKAIRTIDPCVPSGLHDRAADNWRPLLAIAEAAGWTQKANSAIALLTRETEENETHGDMLLQDIFDLFEARNETQLPSRVIVEHLSQLEERPWPEWRNGKPITVRQLAILLSPHKIRPRTIRLKKPNPNVIPIGTETPRGYKREQFEDTWNRYLPKRSATPPQPPTTKHLDGNATKTGPDNVVDENNPEPLSSQVCGGVAVGSTQQESQKYEVK